MPITTAYRLQAILNELQKEPQQGLSSLQSLETSLIHTLSMLVKLSEHLKQSADHYEALESKLSQKADTLVHNSIWKKEVMKGTHRFHTSISKDKSLLSYAKNGVCAGVFAGLDVLKYSTGFQSAYANGKVQATIGNAKVSADADVKLFDGKKWQPSLALSAAASAALAQVKGNLTLGNSYIHADGEASVGVGVVKAEGKAVIRKDELTIKGEVGAAAIQGEVKGSFTLFGVTVTATGTGELGAVGASAEFSSKKGEFSFGAKGSLLAGLGLHVKVKY